MILVVWKYAKMHQNTFLTTPDGQNYLFWKKVSGGLEVCANALKHVFKQFQMLKHIFCKDMILVVWKYSKMHQNTFLTTPDGQKYLFCKKFLVVSKYAQKHQNSFLTTPNVQKYLFLKKSFWWSRCIRKCIKTRL